jgi:arabinofuranosyltransferase
MHGRLLLPALFALVAPVAAVPVTRLADVWTEPAAGPSVTARRNTATAVPPLSKSRTWLLPATVGTVAAVVVVWSAVAGTTLRRPRDGVVDGLFVSEAHDGHLALHGRHAVTAVDQGWGPDTVRAMRNEDVDVYAPQPLPGATPRDGGGRPVYAGWGIGVVGYALGEDVYVLDMLGLADPLVSRFELERPGATGHEKPIPAAWLAARISDTPVPEDALSPPQLVVPLYESPPGQLDEDAEAARRALDCGALADLSRAVHDPLTPGRFLRNVVESPALTRLRVPADPAEAEQRFCD